MVRREVERLVEKMAERVVAVAPSDIGVDRALDVLGVSARSRNRRRPPEGGMRLQPNVRLHSTADALRAGVQTRRGFQPGARR